MIYPTFRHRILMNFEGEAEAYAEMISLKKITTQIDRLQ